VLTQLAAAGSGGAADTWGGGAPCSHALSFAGGVEGYTRGLQGGCLRLSPGGGGGRGLVNSISSRSRPAPAFEVFRLTERQHASAQAASAGVCRSHGHTLVCRGHRCAAPAALELGGATLTVSYAMKGRCSADFDGQLANLPASAAGLVLLAAAAFRC